MAFRRRFAVGGKSVGDYAFQYCDLLSTIVLSDGLESVGDYVFYGCKSLNALRRFDF
ncbi:MAG: leucine-rich repeat protein [Thermoguttaceae bacterium]|nr:leucine-rich repeat protein [Thermoguttaceae bacterium]